MGGGAVYSASAQQRDPFGFVTNTYSMSAWIKNGDYTANVGYYSYTGHKARYTLRVKVENGYISVIYFEDGGYLHTNSDSYYFDGGKLSPIRDQKGTLIAAEGEVIITDKKNRKILFEIVIQ